ncbi:MAG TPA: HEAT repeat domain-containing protein [Anaeromyxobacteraceae bacterium]|nr:HEAT repeat domain-containing protein [Anaeromyxobacteraceae bacterium]
MRPRTVAVALAAAILAMPARASDPAIQRAIEALRKDPSLKVRAQAALVLGQRGAVDGVPALTTALLEDRAAAVRIAAAAALGRIGDPSATQALEGVERNDPDDEVREAAGRALAELRSRGKKAVDRRSVSVEEATGKGGPAARQALRVALARQLEKAGFSLVEPEEAAFRIKPTVISVEASENGGRLLVSVKAAAVAVGLDGRMAAMIQGGARVKATGARRSDAVEEQLSATALEAAARTLSEDLASQLK